MKKREGVGSGHQPSVQLHAVKNPHVTYNQPSTYVVSTSKPPHLWIQPTLVPTGFTVEKKISYKWTWAVQICVVQESTVRKRTLWHAIQLIHKSNRNHQSLNSGVLERFDCNQILTHPWYFHPLKCLLERSWGQECSTVSKKFWYKLQIFLTC